MVSSVFSRLVGHSWVFLGELQNGRPFSHLDVLLLRHYCVFTCFGFKFVIRYMIFKLFSVCSFPLIFLTESFEAQKLDEVQPGSFCL